MWRSALPPPEEAGWPGWGDEGGDGGSLEGTVFRLRLLHSCDSSDTACACVCVRGAHTSG